MDEAFERSVAQLTSGIVHMESFVWREGLTKTQVSVAPSRRTQYSHPQNALLVEPGLMETQLPVPPQRTLKSTGHGYCVFDARH